MKWMKFKKNISIYYRQNAKGKAQRYGKCGRLLKMGYRLASIWVFIKKNIYMITSVFMFLDVLYIIDIIDKIDKEKVEQMNQSKNAYKDLLMNE